MLRTNTMTAVALALAALWTAASEPTAAERPEAYRQLVAQAVRYESSDPSDDFAPTYAASLKGIAERALLAEFQPPADAPVRVHFADDTTCDAMCVDYRVGDWPVRFVGPSAWTYSRWTRAGKRSRHHRTRCSLCRLSPCAPSSTRSAST